MFLHGFSFRNVNFWPPGLDHFPFETTKCNQQCSPIVLLNRISIELDGTFSSASIRMPRRQTKPCMCDHVRVYAFASVCVYACFISAVAVDDAATSTTVEDVWQAKSLPAIGSSSACQTSFVLKFRGFHTSFPADWRFIHATRPTCMHTYIHTHSYNIYIITTIALTIHKTLIH